MIVEQSDGTTINLRRPDDERHYRVTWEVDVWADTPEDAARDALDGMREQIVGDGIPPSFDVREVTEGGLGEPVTVDLAEG